MTPDIIDVENDMEEKSRRDSSSCAQAHQPISWYLRPCRYQVIDRLMILACMLASLTLVSWTIAQDVVEKVANTADAVTEEASTAEPPAAEPPAAEPPAAEPPAAASPAAEPPAAEAESPAEETRDLTAEKLIGKDSTIEDKAAQPTPLTVEPLDVGPLDVESLDDSVTRVLRAEGRPVWIDTPPVSSEGLEIFAVSSDPKLNHEEALASLDAKLRESLQQYIDNYLGVSYAHAYLPFDLEHYKSRLVREGDRYDEIVKYSVGTMHESHAMLSIDAAFRQDIQRRWQSVVTSMRLFRTGGISIGVLALILVVFSYLRLDTVTRGYYSGRLRMFGALAILGLIAGAAYFFQYNLEWLRLMIYA